MAENGGTVSPQQNKCQSDSPPSLKGDNSPLGSLPNSSTSSPLLDTAPLPSDNDAICPYCGHQFRKPRVLDCLHSMCEDCIIAQLDGRRDVDSRTSVLHTTDCELENTRQMRLTPPGVIRCPVCHQESHVGNDVRFVSHLLLDFVRIHEAESVSAMSGVRACRACKSEQPAVAICKECASDLCKNCVQAHRDMKLFDGHTVLTYSELADNPSVLPREPVMCVMHSSMPYILLCASCEMLICAQCHSDHADSSHHKLITVDERVGQLVKSELSEIAAHANAKAKMTEQACICIPDRQSALSNQYDAARSLIEDSFADYASALEEAKEQLLKELEKMRDEREADLNNLSHRVGVTTVKIADALAFTERLLEKGSAFEILASRKKVRQQLTALLHSIPDMATNMELSYSRSPHAQFIKQLSNIVGNISCRLSSDAIKEDLVLNSVSVDSNSFKQLMKLHTFPSDPSLTHMTGTDPGSTRTTPGIVGRTQSSAFSTYTPGPGAIGMERRHKSAISSHNSNADFTDGWPPSSVPPEPPSASPPNDFTIPNSDGGSSLYSWPPSSNPLAVPDPRGLAHSMFPAAPTTLSANIPAMNSQQMSTAINNLFCPQKPNNLWTAQQAAAVSGQLSGGYGIQLRRPNPPSLFDQLVDPTALHLALNSLGAGMGESNPLAALQSALPQLSNAMGRQSQCGTPSDPQGLHERQFIPLNIAPALRGSASKNNAAAIDLTLRWHVGGMGSAPGQFNSPHGFCLGFEDEILIADTNNHRIQVLSRNGKVMAQFGLSGTDEGHLYYPKKIIAVRMRGILCDGAGYVIVDKGENKARLQLYSKTGEFIRKIVAPFIEYVSALTTNECGHLVVFSSSSMMFVLDIEQIPAKVIKWADCSKILGEPSDVSVFEGLYYVSDYKLHCVVVLNIDGELVRKFGSFESTPYPIGVDVCKSGDVLVADSHGNHFHILACAKTGQKIQDFECTQIKVSRCQGLRITSDGQVVSISKHNHYVLMFNTVYLL